MPIRYECYKCQALFNYSQIEVKVRHPDYNERYIQIRVACKHQTFTEGLGSTGQDYICGECIKEAVAND